MSGLDRNDQLMEYYNVCSKSCISLNIFIGVYLILPLETYSSCTLTSQTFLTNCKRCSYSTCNNINWRLNSQKWRRWSWITTSSAHFWQHNFPVHSGKHCYKLHCCGEYKRRLLEIVWKYKDSVKFLCHKEINMGASSWE